MGRAKRYPSIIIDGDEGFRSAQPVLRTVGALSASAVFARLGEWDPPNDGGAKRVFAKGPSCALGYPSRDHRQVHALFRDRIGAGLHHSVGSDKDLRVRIDGQSVEQRLQLRS